ncbi:hypothetical protein JW964_25730 [candidate division KSB1 bacterium]|nr:hypothetical protein [candidate division KSB1 bacterium]
MKLWLMPGLIFIFTLSCTQQPNQMNMTKRLFNNESFWNHPIKPNPEIDERSDEWIALLKTEPNTPNIGINVYKWTIPVYEVDENTPTLTIHRHQLSEAEKINWDTQREYFGHGPGFGENVPIPPNALPDPEEDAHFSVVDWQRKIAWDMWGFRKRPDGTFESNTGMKYKLDGDGVFDTKDFQILNGESVHFHGPSRASGVPAIAGLIMYDEVIRGKIAHKLAIATRFAAFQEFIYPAAWTDGYTPGGIPEGAVIQLNPELDLSQFDLTSGEVVVARALQEYGAVFVDVAQGTPLYAEGLWGHRDKSWEGILHEWDRGICTIPIDNYRFLKVGATIKKGDARSLKKPYW